MTAKNRFEPVHAAHAIEQVHCGLQYIRPLTPEEFGRVMQAAAHFAAELPGRQEVRGMAFSVGPGGVSQVVQSTQGLPDGLVLSRHAPNSALLKELQINPNGIAFRTLSYTRWAHAWNEMRALFAAVVQAVGGNIGFGAYQLQYVDKLIWNGPIDQIDIADGLRRGSSLLAPHVFEQTDLWHSHTGKFERASARVKRLFQINCDCLDETGMVGESRRVVRVTATIGDMLNQVGFDAVPGGVSLSEAESSIIELHEKHLQVIKEIVSDAMATRIGLNSDG